MSRRIHNSTLPSLTGKREFRLLSHLLVSAGTASRPSVLSPTGAQHCQSILFSLRTGVLGKESSSALSSDALTLPWHGHHQPGRASGQCQAAGQGHCHAAPVR